MIAMKKPILLGVILALFAFPTVALAAPVERPLFEDKVVFQGTYTLESDEVLDGNLLVFGGIVKVEDGALITGDAVILGGNVQIDGQLGGTLVAIGGVVSLSDSVRIHGDLIAPASVVQRDAGAQIDGQIITDTGPIDIPSILMPELEPETAEADPRPFNFGDFNPFQPVLELMTLMLQALLFSAMAVVTMLVAPQHMQRTRNALTAEPVVSGGFGLFTAVVALAATLFLAFLSVLVITIPFTVLGMLLLSIGFLVAAAMGWFAVGAEIGERIAEALNQEWTAALHSGVGTFVLTLFIGFFGVIFLDFFGSLFGFLLLVVGVGAVLLTRFGTRDYVPEAALANGGDQVSE